MLSSFQRLFNRDRFGLTWKPDIRFRLIILGLDAVGKTTILYKIRKSHTDEVVTTIPTIGFNVETVELDSTAMTCWDVGGCDKIRPLWRHYFEGAHGLIFVVDSNDADRIESARDELFLFLSDENVNSMLPLLILLNKQDLPNALSKEELLTRLGIREFLVSNNSKRSWNAQECIGTEGIGLMEGFQWLNTALLGHTNSSTNLYVPSSLTLASNNDSSIKLQMSWSEYAANKQMKKSAKVDYISRASSDISEDLFLAQLNDYSLNIWDHYTHLRLAWIFISKHGFEDGCKHIEKSIHDYILHSANTDGSGKSFHRTMTRFWCYIISVSIHFWQLSKKPYRHIITTDPGFGGFLLFCFEYHGYIVWHNHTDNTTNKRYDIEVWNKSYFKNFYSNELMFSSKAKSEIVLPDLQSLPFAKYIGEKDLPLFSF